MSTLAQLNIEVTSAGIVETTAALTSLENRAKNVQFETLQLNKANITQEQGNKNATKSYELMVLQLARSAEGIARLKMELQGFTSKQVEHILLLTKEAEAEAYAMEMSKAHYFALREDINRTRTIEADALKAKVKAEAEGYSYLMEISKAYYQAHQEEAKRNAAIQAEIAATTAKRIAEAAKTQQAARTTSAGIFSDESDPLIDKLKARVAKEASIRQYGADHIRTLELVASQEEIRIHTVLAETRLRLEREILDGTIRSRGQANAMRQAALNLAERELIANNELIISQRAVNAELEAAGKAHSTFHSIAVKSLSIITAMGMYRGLSFLMSIPGQILDVNRKMESLKILLEGVTGSAQNAKLEFDRLLQIDIKTPFDIEGLTKTFVMLKNYGLEPTDMLMKSLTDSVAKLGGGTEQLIGIGRQLGQAWTKDKLQQMDMRPMIENGLPVINYLSEALGKSAKEILAMSQAGTIGRKEMMLLFEQMEKNAPNAAARNMESLKGALSNVTTAWTQLLDAILENKSENALRQIFQALSGILFKWRDDITNTIDLNKALMKNWSDLNDVRRHMAQVESIPFRNLLPGLSDSELKRQEAVLLKEQENIVKKMQVEELARYQQKDSAVSKTAADLAELAISEKKQAADIKAIEVLGRIEEESIKTTNAAIDAEINGVKRKNLATIGSYEAELKLEADKFSRNELDRNTYVSKATELSKKIIQIKRDELDEIAAMEATKLEKHMVDVDKAWAAIVKVESSNLSAQVNRTSGAVGPGQALASTLTGIKNGKDVGVGYGMEPFKPAVDEHLVELVQKYKAALDVGKETAQSKIYYDQLTAFSNKHGTELQTWLEKYFKAIVVATGSVEEALKHYGENSKEYREAVTKFYDEYTGKEREKIKLQEEGFKITDEKTKLEIKGRADIAAIQKQSNDDLKKQDDIDAKIIHALVDRYNKATMTIEKYNEAKAEGGKASEKAKPGIIAFTETVVTAEIKKDETKKATTELDDYNKKLDNTHDKMLKLGTINESVFGGALSGINAMSTGFEKMINTLSTANDKLDENTKKQALNNAQAESPEKIANAQKYADVSIKLNQNIVDAKLTGTMEMASAVSGMLKKGSDAQKVAHAIEMGIAAWQMTQQAFKIAGYIKEGAIWLSLNATKIAGQIKETALHAAAALGFVTLEETKGTAAATTAVAVAAQSSPWTGFITAAAMIAAMAAIGFSLAGGSSAPKMTGADYQKQQEEAYATSLGGTVLGSNEASKSIVNALDIISENSSADLDYTKGMANSLTKMVDSLGLATTEISKNFNFSTSQLRLGTNESKGFFNSSKTSREFAGSGIDFVAQSLSDIINNGIKKAQEYTDILVTKTSSGWFGSSTRQSVETRLETLDASIANAISQTLALTGQSIVDAAKLIGVGTASISAQLSSFVVDLGRMPLGTDSVKNNELLTNAMSKVADQMALLNPMFLDFQKAGEGYYETLLRMSVAVSTAQSKLKTLSITAIDYTNVLVKTADVEKQMVVQSIIASSKMEDLNTIMSMLPGTADDALDAFKNLVAIKQGLKDIGAASVLLDSNLIVTAGGISALKESLASYFDAYFTDQEKLISNTDTLKTSFANLGLIMPSLNATFDATTGVVTDAEANYKALLDVLKNDTTDRGKEIYILALAMSSDFADAAELSVQLVKERLAELNKIVDISYTRQINIYKELAKHDPTAAEHALALEREKAMLGMDEGTTSYTKAINALSDASIVLTTSQTALETAYKNLTAMRDKFVSLGKGLKDYYNELTGAKKPNATPEEIYKATKESFLTTSSLSAKGDAEALSSLPEVSKAFLEASLKYNATGDAYQADYNAVLKSLETGMSAVDKQIEIMNAQLEVARKSNTKLIDLDLTTATVNSTVAGLGTTLATYTASLVTYNSASSLAKEILTGIEKLITSTKTEIANTAPVVTTPDPAIAAAEALRVANIEKERVAAIKLVETKKAGVAKDEITKAQTILTENKKAIEYYQPILDYWKGQSHTGHAAGWKINEWRRLKIDQDARILSGDQWQETVNKLQDAYKINFPGYADGGMANGLSIVGERGPELVNFGSPANVTNHSATTGLFDNISKSIRDSSELQAALLKEQVIELQALVNLQSNANVAMIKELKEMKAEMAELTRKAKLEASS